MRDWAGTRIREDALKVKCRDCLSEPGAECVRDDGQPLTAFPAHAHRINDAQKEPA